MQESEIDVWEQFEALCRAMEDPAFYPHPVLGIERRDTHISAVFLTGRWVYKLKKPVDFGFLDFRGLNDRHRFCEREVRLNQRLSRGVYEDVIGIFRREDGRFSFQASGRIVEYAVKMRQLPDDAGLNVRLKKGTISAYHMEALGKRLAEFYRGSQRNSEIDHYGSRDVIRFNMEENFRQLASFVGEMLDSERWEFLCQVSRSYFSHQGHLFERRVDTGRICDGHGDLRTDHIYFDDGIQIIDCIEFNDRFRYGDAVADLAFLQMDMDSSGHGALGRAVLAAYADEADDLEFYGLIDFYATYRAVVKLKTTWLRYAEVKDEAEREVLMGQARDYLDLAYRYALQFSRPTMWVFCGLPASGKSVLALALAEILSVPSFQSDRVRKESLSVSDQHVVPFGHGLYRPGMRHQVYLRLLSLAQEAVKKGSSVILDATFSHRKWRDAVRLLAADLDTNIIFVQCICREETIRQRLKDREKTSGLSDARLEHFSQMVDDFEPVVELPEEMYVAIDTDQPVRRALAALLSEGYARKCRQVGNLL
jgi:aminoglycoside phosphotransferase family enzyme/predicted kinase